MFTGLVEELGGVLGWDGDRLRIEADTVLAGAAVGDSIAVNGACLTAVGLGERWFEADVVAETRGRTNLDTLEPGAAVNLERPVAVDGRLGGHIVLGHVDGVGEVLAPAPDLEVRLPDDLARYVVAKGSIAVDGVSLTVVAVGGGSFTVAVIPHTAEATTLGGRRPGDRVNLEVDIMAKHVERLLEAYRS